MSLTYRVRWKECHAVNIEVKNQEELQEIIDNDQLVEVASESAVGEDTYLDSELDGYPELIQ